EHQRKCVRSSTGSNPVRVAIFGPISATRPTFGISPGRPGKRFPIALRGILASKGCVIRIALLLGAMCLSVNAGELAGVITAQKSFVNAATELEKHVGDFHSPEELATGMHEYLRAKKQLQDEIEKELPEIKAQIGHRKLPTPEGLELGLHLKDFP